MVPNTISLRLEGLQGVIRGRDPALLQSGADTCPAYIMVNETGLNIAMAGEVVSVVAVLRAKSQRRNGSWFRLGSGSGLGCSGGRRGGLRSSFRGAVIGSGL